MFIRAPNAYNYFPIREYKVEATLDSPGTLPRAQAVREKKSISDLIDRLSSVYHSLDGSNYNDRRI